jgi:hypothetical protein
MSTAASAAEAAHAATEHALAELGDASAALAVVFVSAEYRDAADAAPQIRALLGDTPIVGGTSRGCVFEAEHTAARGLSLMLLGGEDLEVRCREAPAGSPEYPEVVEAGRAIAVEADVAAVRGFPHFACLAFAPGGEVDGEGVVAALRKGAGVRAQLAGALIGDELAIDTGLVLASDRLARDRITVTGLFSRRPIGVASRHGQHAAGEVRTITRADGPYLIELDQRPALDVWLADVVRAGGAPPSDPEALVLYLMNNFALGLELPHFPGAPLCPAREVLARTPFAIRADGAIQLSASVPDGARVTVLNVTRSELVQTARAAADAASHDVGGPVAGALVLACCQRLSLLGEEFPAELRAIGRRLHAPIVGTGVLGEIARNPRDVDAFFNHTVTLMAFPS